MKKVVVFFLVLITSCSSKEEIVDLESIINQGKKINLITKKDLNKSEISIIKKIEINKTFTYPAWSEENQNSKNLFQPVDVFFDNKKIFVSKNLKNYIIHNNQLILIDSNSNLIIYNLKGKKINSRKIYNRKIYKNYEINYSILANKNNLFVSDTLGNIHNYNLENLNLIWKKNYGVPFRSNLKVNRNNLYLINSNSKLFSIKVDSGNLNWSYETSSQSIKDQKSYQIAIYNDKIFFTNDSSELICLDLNQKKIIWSLIFENDNFGQIPLISKSSPITIDNDGIIYISSNNGNTYAINANLGSLKWISSIYSLNKFVISNKYLFNVYENNFFILNKSNGKVLFNKKIKNVKNKKKFIFKDIVIGKNKTFLLDANGFLVSIDNEDLFNVKIDKKFSNYLNFIIFKNDVFINTSNSILKFQ